MVETSCVVDLLLYPFVSVGNARFETIGEPRIRGSWGTSVLSPLVD